MKNTYKLICVTRDLIDNHLYINYRGTFTNKVKATEEYKYWSRRNYVQWIMLKNMTTSEVLKAEATGNVSFGDRTKRIVLK